MEAVVADERDAQWEDRAIGYRVVTVREHGTHWSVHDLESASLSEVESWAQTSSGGSPFSIAARVSTDGGVGLIWLTPPPESFAESARAR